LQNILNARQKAFVSLSVYLLRHSRGIRCLGVTDANSFDREYAVTEKTHVRG